MQGRQLAAILLCSLFLVPAPGVVATDSPTPDTHTLQETTSDTDGVYVPDDPDGDTGDTGVEYAGLAVVDSDGTILDKSTIGPGERLRVEVTIPDTYDSDDSEYISDFNYDPTRNYNLMVDGVDEVQATRRNDKLTDGRFSNEPVLVFNVSYAELAEHRGELSDGLTVYIEMTGLMGPTAPRIDHFELAEESDDGGWFDEWRDHLDGILGGNESDTPEDDPAERPEDGSDSPANPDDPEPSDAIDLTMITGETDPDVQPVNLDDPIRVTVAIENTDTAPLRQDVFMFINGTERVDRQTVALDPGENKTIELTHTMSLTRDREIPVRVEAGFESATIDAYVLGHENAGRPQSGDSANTDIEAKFYNCTYVELSGTFTRDHIVQPSLTWYNPMGSTTSASQESGMGQYILRGSDELDAPFTGTIVITISGDEYQVSREADDRIVVSIPTASNAVNGSTISGVYAKTELPDYHDRFTFLNSNNAHCINQTRPEQPTLSFEQVDQLENGKLGVMFQYTNPNGRSFDVKSNISNAKPQHDPPTTLRPGRHPITAVWDPATRTERVTWKVNLNPYGYNETLTVTTPQTAGEYLQSGGQNTNTDPSDKTGIKTEITDTNVPITGGQAFEATVSLTNRNSVEATRDVFLVVGDDPEQVDEKEVTLQPGESTTITLGYQTPSIENDDTFPIIVGAGGTLDPTRKNADKREITVHATSENGGSGSVSVDPPMPLTSAVPVRAHIIDTNTPLQSGQDLEATIEVSNPNSKQRTGTVRLVVGDDPQQVDSQKVTLKPGYLEEITLGYTTPEINNDQTFPIRTKVGDTTTSSEEVTVRAAPDERNSQSQPDPRVTITDANTPLTSGKYLEATIQVKNPHDQQLNPNIRLVVGTDPEQVDSQTISLQPGETKTITLGYETPVIKVGQKFPIYAYSGDTTNPQQPGADGHGVHVRANLDKAFNDDEG